MAENNSEESVFEQVEEEIDGVVALENEIPVYGSEKWNEYVMRQFHDSEMMNGAPTCDGCRRVVEQLIGPIINTEIPANIYPSSSNNGTATVRVRIDILIKNEIHPAFGLVTSISVEDIADVNRDNTDTPYSLHQSATAATRAEGRCLRKLLRLTNVITAEEKSEKADSGVSDIDWTPDEPINDDQINVIDTIASRLSIDVMGFINSGRKIYADIYDVSKTTAQKMIQELNAVQRKIKPRPNGIGDYKANWRNK